jgi:hypothetical protein
MRMIVLASFIALVGCDHPMFHQDRPGGTHYAPMATIGGTVPANGEVAQAQRDATTGIRPIRQEY